MSDTRRVVKVSTEQVLAAQALVRLHGGIENVDAVVAKIACARPAVQPEAEQDGRSAARKIVKVSSDQVSAAQALVRLHGGIENVDAVVAKIARARPASELSSERDTETRAS